MNVSELNTTDPVALRFLMTETIFGMEEEVPGAVASAVPVALPETVQGQYQTERDQTFAFYGENKRNYLFLTQDDQHPYMSPDALEAFTKTLGALKLTMDDVAVFNIRSERNVPQEGMLRSFFKPKVVVSLGASLPAIGVAIQPMDGVVDYSGLNIFATCSFDDMLVDAEKKRLFWTTIKTLLV